MCVKFLSSQVHYAGFDNTRLDSGVISTLNKLDLSWYGKNYDKILDLQYYFPFVFDHLYINNCMNKTALNEAREMAKQVKVNVYKYFYSPYICFSMQHKT